MEIYKKNKRLYIKKRQKGWRIVNHSYHYRVISPKKLAGFTLVEMSFVLLIISIVATSLLAYASLNHQQSKHRLTHSRLDDIEEALHLYAIKNNRLPCPAALDAVQGDADYAVPADCSITAGALPDGIFNGNGALGVTGNNEEMWIGTVPTRILNLPDRYMVDAWNQRFSYGILYLLAQNDMFNADGSIAYALDNADGDNGIQIQDQYGNDKIEDTLNGNENIIAYVIFSHGENGSGAYSRLGTSNLACAAGNTDTTNCDYASDLTNNFIDQPVSVLGGGSYFDDIIRWKPIHFLKELD